ncbi:MAG: hypothetical protein ACYCZW_01935 [Minisyncoccota bacterium]
MFNSFLNKKVVSSIFILIFFLSFIVYPKKTEAFLGVGDIVLDPGNLVQNTVSAIANPTTAIASVSTSIASIGVSVKELGLDGVGNAIAKMILRKITAQTVNWINSGFEGNPAFVTDPQRFFLNIADQTASQLFLGANSPLNQLCSPFRAEVRLALVKNYLYDNDAQFQCTFGRIGANFENFTRDFSQGGWDAWFVMTQQNQNNPYGSYIEGQKLLTASIQTQQGIKQKQIADGRGFLSYERCRRDYVPPKTNPSCTKYEPLTVGGGEPKCLVYEKSDASGEVLDCPASEKEVVTPGSVINEQLGKALGSPFAQLEAADEINEIVNALMIQLIEKTFSSVQGGLRGLSRGSSNEASTLQQLQDSVSDTQLKKEIVDATGSVPKQFQPALTGGDVPPLVTFPTEAEIRLQVDKEKQQFCLENPQACQTQAESNP